MKTKNKILKYVTCGVLAAMTAVTATFVGAGCKKEEKAELPNIPIEDKVYDNNGNEMTEDTFYAMPQSMTFAPRAVAMAAGESVLEANVTATITPSDAANKLVDWSLAFKNASSTWANGKTVTDYVTVTPTSNGSLSAKVTCKQAFGEQIVMTVTSRSNTSVKATCTLDYKQQFLGYGITVSGNNTVTADYTSSSIATGLKVNLETAQQTVIMPSYKKSTVYTIARGDTECPKVGKIEVTLSAALSSALKAVKDGAQTLTVPSDPSSTPMNLFNKTWLDGLSLTQSQKNSVITAIKNNVASGLIVTFKNSSGTTLDSWTLSLDTSNIGSVGVTGITLDKSTIVFE